ncbi:MAG: LAGLIDADG family homing endonuclease [Candidatus Daviesbacteria bacterium]|nr:LAGLIDADG family homing endonuclease [Candidatus Daviesbacteria bacterium]
MARVLLSKEIQYQLCFTAREKLGVNWAGLARYFQISPSTLANWYKCERLLPLEIFSNLVKITNISISNPKLLNDNWGRVKGGKMVWSRYGRRPINKNPGYGKDGISLAKKFPIPSFSRDLAEFVGIMLGDGGMSQNQISVTLGYTTDRKYVPYIRKLIGRLFQAKTSTYRAKRKDVIRIRASGVNLVKNLLALGLVQGNKIKQQFDIPVWIQQSDDYIRSCVRGLIDTDGCVHRKVRKERNGFEYRSIGITFCSASKPLQKSFMQLLDKLGFKPAISGRTIYLCGEKQIKRYINEIGFSNSKHLFRYKAFLEVYGWKKVASEKLYSSVI